MGAKFKGDEVQPGGLEEEFGFRGEGEITAGEEAAIFLEKVVQTQAKVEDNGTFFGEGDGDCLGEGGHESFGDEECGHSS
jgi:hypothetical protein